MPIDFEFAVLDDISSYSDTGCIYICPPAMWLTYEIGSGDVHHFHNIFFTHED